MKRVIGEGGFFNTLGSSICLEIGYIIDNPFWGKGLGTETCQALIRYGFTTLKLHKIVARMFAENSASINVATKCGMHLNAKGTLNDGQLFFEMIILNE